ncbi:MAG: integrase arm-type DNA-binding domain-containing protein [Deltaproteobacteria bacterium]|nr:integrase arm-type DNA-binding domain-containing protein [Deltaproteobacteria bacterium]
MLTDAKVKTLKAREERSEVADGGRNGLVLRVTPNGVKTWALRYRMDGKPRKLTLGTYPALTLEKAREAAVLERAKLEKGIDPGAAKQQEKDAARAARQVDRLATTLGNLAADYVEKYAKPRKRSWKEDERYLEQDVKPVLGKLKALDVTREHVRGLLREKMEAGSPIAANRLLAVVRKMFAWAVDEGILSDNPCAGLKAPGKKVSKDRVLTPEEVRKVWALLEPPTPRKKDDPPPKGPVVTMSSEVRRALRLILVTAQRPGEVLGMTWEEIEGTWWTVPSERAKNGLSHRVHLSKLALEILGTRGTGNVFPSPKVKEDKPGHIDINALAKAVRRSQEALGVAPWTPHDLRRTAASLMAGAGVSPFTVERVLNHTLQGVQAVYNRHSYDAEKREALNRWAAQLGRILAGKGDEKVIPIRATRSGSR